MTICKYKNDTLKKKIQEKFGSVEKTYYLCTRKKEMKSSSMM